VELRLLGWLGTGHQRDEGRREHDERTYGDGRAHRVERRIDELVGIGLERIDFGGGWIEFDWVGRIRRKRGRIGGCFERRGIGRCLGS
jgi:hypothetical protein